MIKRLIAANRRREGWCQLGGGAGGDFLTWRPINSYWRVAKRGHSVIGREANQIEILRRYSGRVNTEIGEIKMLLIT